MAEMNDQELSAVTGQLGIVDLTTLGVDIELGPLGAPLFCLPFTLGSAKIGLPGFIGASDVSFAPSIAPSLVDCKLTNLGPTLTPFGLKIGLFDAVPAIIDGPDLAFKGAVLGGSLLAGAIGAVVFSGALNP